MLVASLLVAVSMMSCDKEKELERDNFSQKTVVNFQLSSETLLAYPILNTLITNKAMLDDDAWKSYAKTRIFTKYKHGSGCGSSKGLCVLDTLAPSIPAGIDFTNYSLSSPMPTNDTLYPGDIYLISNSKMAFFPSADMHLSNNTVPIADTMYVPATISAALGKSDIIIYPGLYSVHTNVRVIDFAPKGYIVVDCAAN